MNNILAIDPGASGGWAVGAYDRGEIILRLVEPMPEGMSAQIDRLRAIRDAWRPIVAIVERGGLWRPGDHPNAACKFARHCGALEAALYALDIATEQAAASVWQRSCGPLPKDRAARKRAIRELMARRFPMVRPTLRTADALAILCWALARNVTTG